MFYPDSFKVSAPSDFEIEITRDFHAPRALVFDAFTTPVRPFDSAISAMINSAALPKVALNNPPAPWPRCSASSSVARPIQPARGTTATQEQTNKAVSFSTRGQIRSTMATGTKTSDQFSEGLSNDFIVGKLKAFTRNIGEWCH